MPSILVASAKGGVGKTTLSTNLAGALSLQGHATALVDTDPQGSALIWGRRRDPDGDGGLQVLDGTQRNWRRRIRPGTDFVVLDSPAGAMPSSLRATLDWIDALLVPVLPSALDLEATVRFLNPLAEHPRAASGALRVGLVANRLRPHTRISRLAVEQLSDWPCELVASLRDSQAYVLLVGLGRCLFDYQSRAIRDHQQDWQPLLDWLPRAD